MTEAQLIDLGNRLYQAAMVRNEQETITDPSGAPIRWMLDTRMPMLDTAFFGEVGSVVAKRLYKKGISQVVGMGYGAFPLVCSVLSAGVDYAFKGGFVREKRKSYGRKRLVEGPLDRNEPIVLMDDVLNSGKNARQAIQMLRDDGFNVVGVFTLFCFTWGNGKENLRKEGIWVDSLLDLNLRTKTEYLPPQNSDTGVQEMSTIR
jgi:orotate phosphoribosyltransferase